MNLKIVCFEDSQIDMDNLQKIFAKHDVKFLFFMKPDPEWKMNNGELEKVVEFKPDFAIVDLKDDVNKKDDEGRRIIKKLKESSLGDIPVLVWSVHFKLNKEGDKWTKDIEKFGGIPFYKNRNNLPSANDFLRKVGL